jgi:hypothetical protein
MSREGAARFSPAPCSDVATNTVNKHTPDPDVEAAFRWLVSYLPAGEWVARKAAVEQQLEGILTPKAAPPPDAGYYRLIGPEADQITDYMAR